MVCFSGNITVFALDKSTIQKEFVENRRLILSLQKDLSWAILDYQQDKITNQKLFDISKEILFNQQLAEIALDKKDRISEIFEVLDENFSYQNRDLLLTAQAIQKAAQHLLHAASSAAKIPSANSTEAKMYIEIADLYLHIVNIYDSLTMYNL